MNFNIILPPEVEYIIKKLNSAEFEAYAVGGCVRDSIMGITPSDWDVATSARPHQVKGLFEKTADSGIKYGTVTVILFPFFCEVTTFRGENGYRDFRHPDEIVFADSLEEDLARRDFTINAIAWNPQTGLKDPFGGINDIKDKLIRTVGEAGKRFGEDALRMLRAVRFSARFGFRIHEDTIAGIKKNGRLIEKISKERIRDELTGILVSDSPEKIRILWDTNVMQYILPEVEASGNLFSAVSAIENDPCLRWTMLLHDVGKDEAGVDKAVQIMKRLKFDNKSIKRIGSLIKFHDLYIEPSPVGVRKAVSITGKENFPDLLKVKRACLKSKNSRNSRDSNENDPNCLDKIQDLYDELIRKNYCTSLKELEIDGHDLISMGFKEGKKINEILNYLLDQVIEKPDLNQKEKLLNIARVYGTYD